MNFKQDNQKQSKSPFPAEHWPDISRLWEQVGPPLRPSKEDIEFINDAIGSLHDNNIPARALILGVTPEMYHLPCLDKTKILASDHTKAMIDDVWPGPRSTAICTEWTTLPLLSGSREIVLCDGGIHLMTYPAEQRQLVRTLHRVVAIDGLCIFRLFVPPREQETAEDVIKDLLEGRISNLNLLKLRLGMALQEDTSRGVELRKIWNTIRHAAPDFNQLALQIGWPLKHLQVINTYRNSPVRYYFMSVSDVRHLFCQDPGGFEFVKIYSPTYELGERCPTVVFRRVDLRHENAPIENAP